MKGISIGYTIWNKKGLLPKVIYGLKESFGENDEFVFLFDNCTDDSIGVFESLKRYLPSKPKIIITYEDLYEVKANNRLLEESTGDIVILFQDDIVCHDKNIREKVKNIVHGYGNKLGLLGGRSGFELTGENIFPERTYYRVSNWEHLGKQYGEKLPEGGFKERTFLNRGPLVFTRKLLNQVGYLDEEFAPLWGDDLDYCAEAKFKYHKKNVVFQCDVESQLKWGALHTGQSSLNLKEIMKRNWNLFIERWGETIKENR